MIVKIFKTKKDKRTIYRCDECGKEVEVSWYYLKARDRLETQYCRSCTAKIQNTTSKRKSTCIEKYGYRNPMQVDEFKKKYVESNNKTYDRQRTKFEDIKKSFEQEGYTLLTTDYINNRQKLECICSKGHKLSTTWNYWSRGKTVCRKCSSEEKVRKKLEQDKLKEEAKKNKPKRVAHNKFDYNYVKEFFEKEGYTLISDTYDGSENKSKVVCPRGHKWDIEFRRFKSGVRCKYCSYEDRGINRRLKFEDVNKYFKDQGYSLITKDYTNTEQKLEYICSKDHINHGSFHNFKDLGNRCAKCSRYRSKGEKEVYNFVKSYYSEALSCDRQIINPLELDIVIPSKKVAIEYCGIYWHTENFKDKKYHLNKLNKCNEIGYRLITIFEDEWETKKEIVKCLLKNILGVSESEPVHARKCIIEEIDNNTKNEFLDEYHIQGKDVSSVRLGLFYNNDLVAVMTFSKGSIAKGTHNLESGVYELNRFCTDYKYNIRGGASKLLKYFIRNYNPSKIYSYADKRWSEGDLYKKLGFEFVRNTDPNYWYVKQHGTIRFHRFNFRKSELKDKLEVFNPNLTEYDNMVLNDYKRVWDCGHIKYEMQVK